MNTHTGFTESVQLSQYFQPAFDRDRISPAESPSQNTALDLSYLVCVRNRKYILRKKCDLAAIETAASLTIPPQCAEL